MPSTITATAKGPTSNSYVTLNEAIAYFGDRLYKDAWVNAGTSDKTAALLWATKLLDTRVEWSGNKTTTTQALDWPRANVPNPEAEDAWGTTSDLNQDTIPQFVKDAQCEMALALLKGDVTLDPDSVGMLSVSVGSISVTYNPNQKPEVLPRPVRDLVSPYGAPISASGGMVNLIRM